MEAAKLHINESLRKGQRKMNDLLPTLTKMVSTTVAPLSVQFIVASLKTCMVILEVYSDPLTPTLIAEILPQAPSTPDL